MARESRSVARVVAALVATTWLIGIAPVLLGGRTPASEPHLASSLPWFDRMAGAIGGGHLPEWDDASGLGAPVALEVGRPLCYPPAWLVGALPRPWGTDALLVAHLLLFGLGAAAWSRRLGAEPMGAVVAGGGAALSAAALGVVVGGGAICAAAWLPWVGWAVDRLAAAGPRAGARTVVGRALAVAVMLAALLLAAGGAAGAAVVAPVVAAAAMIGRAPGRGWGWLGLLGAWGAALLLSAVAWLPAALTGALRWPVATAGLEFQLAEIPALGLAVAGALTGSAVARRLGAAGLGLVVLGVLAPLSPDGFPAAAAAVLFPLAGVGASSAARTVDRLERLARGRATIGALLATAALGPLAARAWRMPFEPRALVGEPPALLAAAVAGQRTAAVAPPAAEATASPRATSPSAARSPSPSPSPSPSTSPSGAAPLTPFPSTLRRRIAWPEHAERAYRDAPPETGARFGFAYLPGRDRSRDPLLARLWLASSGAGERLLDLFDVQYAVVPAAVAVPASMPVAGQSSSGERVLAENTLRRSRAFVAPRWSWHADPASLQRELFPVAPDQRGSLALGTVRLLGAGPPPPEPARRGPQPAPPCAIDSPRPERVELTCRSSTGGYAVLLDRDAPGWTAAVDGEPAAIVTADLLVRAVAVPRGLHRVSFLYQTPGLRLGALLSAAAWLNALALALLLRRLAQPRASVVPIEPG